jgi:hypothetical protein
MVDARARARLTKPPFPVVLSTILVLCKLDQSVVIGRSHPCRRSIPLQFGLVVWTNTGYDVSKKIKMKAE